MGQAGFDLGERNNLAQSKIIQIIIIKFVKFILKHGLIPWQRDNIYKGKNNTNSNQVSTFKYYIIKL